MFGARITGALLLVVAIVGILLVEAVKQFRNHDRYRDRDQYRRRLHHYLHQGSPYISLHGRYAQL